MMPPAAVDFTPQSAPQQQNPSSRLSDEAAGPRPKPRLRMTKRRNKPRANSGLNRSEPSFVDLNRAMDDVSRETSLKNPNLNVNLDSGCGGTRKNDEFGKCLRGGFAFGGGSSLNNLNLNVNLDSGCGETHKNDEFGKCLSGGLVFGAGSRLRNPNLNVTLDSRCGGTFKNDESGKDLGGGFVFGAGNSFSNLEKSEPVIGFSNGFAFGKSEVRSKKSDFNVDTRQRNVSGSYSNSGCEVYRNDEFGKFLSGGFVFGATNSCSDLKKRESVADSSNGFVFQKSKSGLENPSLNVDMKQSNMSFSNLNGLSNGFPLNNPILNVEMKQSNMSFSNSNLDCKESYGNDECGKSLSGGFAFGAQIISNLRKPEAVNGFSNGFVFGTSESGLGNPNLNVEMKQSNTSFYNSNSDCKESTKGDDFGKNLSGNFVFGTEKSCSRLKKQEYVCELSNEFVFGASESVSEKPSLNVEMKQSNISFSKSNSECKESNKNDKSGKFLSGGLLFSTGKKSCNLEKTRSVQRNPRRVHFKFVPEQGVLNSDSNSTKKVLGEKIENLTRETKGNAEVGCGRGDGSVFSGNWCELGSTLGKTSGKSNENGGKSVQVDSEKMKSGAGGKVGSTGYVFGSSTTSGFQKEFENRGKMKADTESELQKEKVDDVFVFGSSRKGNSFSRDHNKPGSFVNKQNFVFGSSFCETRDHEVSTPEQLTDEMMKLNVDKSKDMGTFDSIKDSTNSCASSDPMFVFGSSGKPSGSYSVQSGNIKIKNAKLRGPAKTGGIYIRIANENKTKTDGVVVSDEPIKLGRAFETFQDKHPTNPNAMSSDDISVGVSSPNLFTFQAGPGKNSVGFEGQESDTFGQSLFSSGLFNVEGFSVGRVEGKDNFRFTSTPAGVESCATDFRTPDGDASCSFSENVSTGFSKNPNCSVRGGSIRNRKWKKLSRKFRKVDPIQRQPSKNIGGSQQNAQSPGHFSPMDFSPYQADQCAASTNATSSVLARDESARKEADTSRREKYFGQAHEFSKNFWENFAAEYPVDQTETVGRSSRTGQIGTNNNDNDEGVADDAFSKCSNSKQEDNESGTGNQFSFPSSTECKEENTIFSKEDDVSATKCRSRKKYRMKVGCGPSNIDPRSQVKSSYVHLNQAQKKEQNTLNSPRKAMNNVEGDEHSEQRATAAAEKACEKWRIRGNQAYEKGYSSKAEEYYTKGINSFFGKGSPECTIEPLVLCYSNRAAARMLCGKMREALCDCVMADSLDPSFQKVQLRAANCHLALGEIEDACQYFSKCLESKGDICLDRRIAIEAASGLQKAQKLASCMNDCAELLKQKTFAAASSALESISAVFPTSSYSEKLLELKAEALLLLRRYKEVIQLCEETLVSAEKNFAVEAGDNKSVNFDATKPKNSTIMLWRWRLMSKSYFYLGKLELALDLLQKQEVFASSDDRSNIKELSFPIAATVRELIHHRSAGNKAFQSGRYTVAVEHYSASISSTIESRPFAAICFCNRAAAQQALGQFSDAISDCSIAIALDGSYTKAISRRATLHEKIRDYAGAASDLERLISLLREQSQDKNCGSAGADSSSSKVVEELRQARRRLSSVEEKANKGLPMDHYLILGVKSTEEASEMKKAYRRAALKHHPDKAAQFLVRGDNGDEGELWKEICVQIQKDADRLFKTIGEAYAVLSDPNKRLEYDLQEESRTARKETRNRDSTGTCDSYSSPFKNRGNGSQFQEYWQTYGHSRSHW